MALQFYIGGSGAGKSRQLHKDIIEAAGKNPTTNYLVIVPDQFTMQTQMDFVAEHPSHGIMNIDVLSFGRLSHRILEEVGADRIPVLDDTGKSLILRRLAEQMQDRLPALGTNMKKIGYIHEVKSAISEFMQYGISPDDVHELINYSSEKGALSSKLSDLELLYRAFLEVIDQKYVTREEKLNLLRTSLHKSKTIKNCCVVFDGFTGFTPVQYGVIEELLVLAKKVIITITMDISENPYSIDGEQKLFHLSKKTISDIKKLADRVSVEEIPPVLIRSETNRFTNNEELRYLEQNLFRYRNQGYEKDVYRIHLTQANKVSEEIISVCRTIKELVHDKGYCYRDIAVVVGNLDSYANSMEQTFGQYDIPVYIDYTRPVLQNPFTRYVRNALQVLICNFSIDSMMKYLRTGMTDLEPAEIDLLENYLRKCGIKGKSAWTHIFAAKGKRSKDMEPLIEQVNDYRERIMAGFAPLLEKGNTAKDYILHLYDFLVLNRSQEKLSGLAEQFSDGEDAARAKEYSQIYRLTMELLEQMEMLLGNEKISFEEFVEILEAGFGEIQVGTIPKEVDRVLIGDMERTRLKQVKVLFFMGINDGNIPRSIAGGGLISDLDREFLQQSDYEFAPTPRQQMYIQRLYLYMNMTKPSDELYLSFASMDEAGTSLQPSYLVGMIQELFPKMTGTYVSSDSDIFEPQSEVDVKRYFAENIRKYVTEEVNRETYHNLQTIYQWEERDSIVEQLVETAFASNQGTPLARQVASALYGQILDGSISRLERYASCAYAHFLQYGLALKEREEFNFEAVDLGNVYHHVLEAFGESLEQNGYTWMNFPNEYGEQLVDELLEQCAVEYGDSVLYSTAQMKHSLESISRILKRSVHTMKYQLNRGLFLPKQYEMSFQRIVDLKDIKLGLSEDEKIRLRGRVDRIDTVEDDEKVYIKVVDYKSGSKDFDLAAVYYGLQLQMVVYMDSATTAQQRKNPGKEIIPAATLYYHLDDPMINATEAMTDEEIEEQVRKALRTSGIVNSDDHVVELLHEELTGDSDVVPVGRKKDGFLTARSHVLGEEEFQLVSNYVNQKIKSMGQEILMGNVKAVPNSYDGSEPCKYCDYKKVCEYGNGGKKGTILPKKEKEEVLASMHGVVEGEE